MTIGVPKEISPQERRVALTPDACSALVRAGFAILVETGAGREAFFSDEDYRNSGATIASAEAVFGQSDIVVKLNKPQENPRLGAHEADMMREGALLISFLSGAGNEELLKRLADRRITVFSMEALPRISRAQAMDALSSQAAVTGYRAALIAAESLPRYFPMMMTAAGTLAPSRVLVLGAGVAGLQAIATSRRLGAIVWGYDIRTAAREQVESLGAKFLDLGIGDIDAEGKGGYARELPEEVKRRQQESLAARIKEFDAVITAAMVPGRRAPVLITKETVAGMRPGSVIIDLAAESGGNCELTEIDRVVTANGVSILGPANLPSTMPIHASQMYASNVSALLMHLVKEGKLFIDLSDEITKAACLTHDGRILQP